jgi:hypothetical protein
MAKTENGDTDERGEANDAPIVDLNEAQLKKVIARAKKRGYITVDELNGAVGEMNTDQIEDVMSALNEMGVNVVEAERNPTTTSRQGRGSADDATAAKARPSSSRRRRRPSIARTIRSACICARWGRWSSCRAKARSRSPSGSRPAATR